MPTNSHKKCVWPRDNHEATHAGSELVAELGETRTIPQELAVQFVAGMAGLFEECEHLIDNLTKTSHISRLLGGFDQRVLERRQAVIAPGEVEHLTEANAVLVAKAANFASRDPRHGVEGNDSPRHHPSATIVDQDGQPWEPCRQEPSAWRPTV